MSDDVSIVLRAELDEGSLDDIQRKLEKIKEGKDNKINIELNKNINDQINILKTNLDKLISKPYNIDIQINQKVVSDIKSLTDSLNQAAVKVQNMVVHAATQRMANGAGDAGRIYTGVSKLIERGHISEETGMFKATSEIEKQNLALGERVTIYRELKKEEDELEETMKETSRQYETNYEEQAKALQKLQNEKEKAYLKDLKANSAQLEFERKQKENTLDYLTDQNNKILDLESKAFKQNNPLSGAFEETAKTSIEAWRSQVTLIENSGKQVTEEQKRQLVDLEATAKRVVLEQQKSQWRADKLQAKDVNSRVSNANFGLDIQTEELKQTGQYTDEVKQKIDALRESLSQVKDQKGFQEWNKQLEQFNNELELSSQKAKTAFKNEAFQLDIENLQTRLQNLKQKYDDFVNANPNKANAGIEETFKRISEEINNIDMDKIDPNKLALLRKEVRNFGSDVGSIVTPAQSLSQILSQSFGGVGQYLARFTSAFYVINKGIQTIKSMVNEVKALDTSLVELQKVTSLTGNSLAEFTDKAYDVGRSLGRTGQDVIDATTTFSRAGYDLQEATELAKSALVMTNVGVDIPNIDSAASDMISILKAFDKQADESMSVIDKLYNVANKEPLDFGNITQMLVTAGGTLAQTGTTLEETMGLLTGGFATLRNTSVANG